MSDIADGVALDARELYLLELAARNADELARLVEIIDREGVMATGSTGQAVVHPAVRAALELRAVQLRLLSKITLDPPIVETPAERRARLAATRRRLPQMQPMSAVHA